MLLPSESVSLHRRACRTTHCIEPMGRESLIPSSCRSRPKLPRGPRSSPKATNGPPRLLRIVDTATMHDAATVLQPSLHIFVAVTLKRSSRASPPDLSPAAKPADATVRRYLPGNSIRHKAPWTASQPTGVQACSVLEVALLYVFKLPSLVSTSLSIFPPFPPIT